MSKVLSYLAGINCIGFFKKLFRPCYAKEDVEAMASKYEEYQKNSFGSLEDKMERNKEDYRKSLEEKDEKIASLENKLKECTSTSGRVSSEREKVIVNLNDQIKSLKEQIRNDNKTHELSISTIRKDCEDKVKRIQKECADALLKADKKQKTESVEKPKTKVVNGVKSLTCDQVVEIRRLASLPKRPNNKELSTTYGVGESTISRIITGKSYKNCPFPKKEK